MFSAQFLKDPRRITMGLLTTAAFWISPASAQSQATDKASIITRGEYLAQAGDCVACHTAPGGKLFAGGRAMLTPFGTLYTSNVTPDADTGIGKWTADQFYSTLHAGRFPDGGLVYPAMPFGSYTKISRSDSDAIFAFMRSVSPVKLENKPHDLKFPYNNRSLIIGWRTLFSPKANINRTRRSRMIGTAAPIWCRALATARCVILRSTRWAAARSRRPSRAVSFRCRIGTRRP
jgi:hypothetical protein